MMKLMKKMLASTAAATLLLGATQAADPAQSWRVERPKDDKPAVLFVGHPLNYIQPGLAKELTDKGFIVDHSEWGSLTTTDTRGGGMPCLRRFNTIVLLSLSGVHGEPWNSKTEDMLDEYMRLGGGVITFFNQGEGFALGKTPASALIRRWFAKHGLDLVQMPVLDPENAKEAPRPKYVYGQKFAPADKVLPSPISDGVMALWYGQGATGYGAPHAFPLLVDDNWTPVVQTRPTAKVSYAKNAQVHAENVKPELDGKGGPWTLVAHRRVGNGRLVAMGLHPQYYVWGPFFDKWDQVCYRNGIGGIPSNFDRLLENSLRWTSAPSLESGMLGHWAGLYPPASQGDTPPINWESKHFEKPGPWYLGVMGAQTAYSGGQGTVAEWAATAKAEGLNFLVFLEDMGKMDAEKWENLKNDCEAASSDDFRCYRGMRYRMKIATGGTNHCFVMDGRNTMPWPYERVLNQNNEISIHEPAGMIEGPYQMDFPSNLGVGYMRHRDNVTPYWDYKLYGSTAVLTRDGDQVLDDAMEMYLEQMPANVNVAPVGIDLMTRPDQLKGIVGSGRPLLVVNGAADGRYPQLAAGLAQVDLHVGCRGEKFNKGFGAYRAWYGPAVTEGPKLSLRFRGGYQWKGVEYSRYWIERYASVELQDWFMPSWSRQPLRLDVSSAEPLDEVVVYDGQEVLCRFDAAGKTEFSVEFAVPQDRNRHLIAFAKDRKGRRALSMEIWTEQQQNLYNYCADRINVPCFGSLPGHGNAYMEGVAGLSPSHKQVANAYPRTIAGFGFESRRYELDLVSPDVTLERASSAHDFPKLVAGQHNCWRNFSRPEPREDVRHAALRHFWYQSHGRAYVHPAESGIHWDGYPYMPGDEKPKSAYYGMQEVWGETLKELTPVKGFGFTPGLSQVLWDGALPLNSATRYQVLRPDGPTDEGDLAELVKQGGRVVGDLPTGSAIVIHTAEGFTARIHGQGLGYAFLMVKAKDANKQDCLQAALRVAPRTAAATIPAGTKTAWRCETVAQVMDNPLKQEIGWLNVAKGKVTGHWVGAAIAADQHLTRFTVGRQPLKVNSTPFTVTGINPNWTVGYFEPKTGLYRPVGVTKAGTAYAQVDAARPDTEVVLGNLVTCDQPELRILATQNTDADGKPTGTWRLDLFNPTDKPMDAALAIDPAFSLVKARALKATVPAKGQTTVEME